MLGERPGELRRLSSGASRETYLLASPSHGELVLQLERGGKPSASRRRRRRCSRPPPQAGVPVARVVAHGEEDEVLGPSWTVVRGADRHDRSDGDPRRRRRCPARAELIDELAARARGGAPRCPPTRRWRPRSSDPLALLRGMHERLGEPHPAFELAFRTLERAAAPPTRRTLVHGDFRMGNLMVDARAR